MCSSLSRKSAVSSQRSIQTSWQMLIECASAIDFSWRAKRFERSRPFGSFLSTDIPPLADHHCRLRMDNDLTLFPMYSCTFWLLVLVRTNTMFALINSVDSNGEKGNAFNSNYNIIWISSWTIPILSKCAQIRFWVWNLCMKLINTHFLEKKSRKNKTWTEKSIGINFNSEMCPFGTYFFGTYSAEGKYARHRKLI